MSITAAGANPIPWWKEPSKDQWLAWIAAWLGWTLDSFDFTGFFASDGADFERLRRASDRGRCRLHAHLVDEAGRRHGVGLARRPDRTQEAVDDLDCLVFGLQSARRPRAELLVIAAVP